MRPWHRPYVLYKWCRTAKLGGAQIIFMSVGAGPITNNANKFVLVRALRLADYRSYRELDAVRFLQSIGYDTSKDLLYPDLVFSLPKASLPLPKQPSTTPVVVGLGMMNYFGWQYRPGAGEKLYQEYIAKMKLFAAWLLGKGFTIRLLSGDVADTWPIQDLANFVREEGEPQWQERLIIEEVTDVHDLFDQIAQTDLVVASRFHNVLCALMLERPVISIGYHAKNDDLMKGMGLGDYCQFIESYTNERLIEQFNSCLQDMDSIVCKIHQHLDSYRDLLDTQYKALLESTD